MVLMSHQEDLPMLQSKAIFQWAPRPHFFCFRKGRLPAILSSSCSTSYPLVLKLSKVKIEGVRACPPTSMEGGGGRIMVEGLSEQKNLGRLPLKNKLVG
jgi:hypothetical protein